VLGTVLLLSGFFQMSSGIKLFSNKYSFESSDGKMRSMYWVWVGAMTLTILVGIWHSDFRKATSIDRSGDSNDPKDSVFDIELDDDDTLN
jgi:hypothetical protein